jgi:hypothetical protein
MQNVLEKHLTERLFEMNAPLEKMLSTDHQELQEVSNSYH